MRIWLQHDCCDYTCVNDINYAYVVDEVTQKCVEMIVNVQNLLLLSLRGMLKLKWKPHHVNALIFAYVMDESLFAAELWCQQ
jgi:hypothetical protein